MTNTQWFIDEVLLNGDLFREVIHKCNMASAVKNLISTNKYYYDKHGEDLYRTESFHKAVSKRFNKWQCFCPINHILIDTHIFVYAYKKVRDHIKVHVKGIKSSIAEETLDEYNARFIQRHYEITQYVINMERCGFTIKHNLLIGKNLSIDEFFITKN